MPTTTTLPYTREAAERIARHGANKMEAQGYTWKREGFSGDNFKVTKPEGENGEAGTPQSSALTGGGEYDVIINDGGRGELHSCSCPFCQFGFRQHTCKHCRFVMDGVQAEDAADATRADEFSEFDNFGRHDLVMGEF